ncbi:translocation/assembly module TamB domain-containing protein [Candidatus Cloacimonadota bacterium]
MKTRKRIFTVILFIISLILLLLLFTQTGFFKNLVRKELIKQVNGNLINAEFRLEQLSGNFLNSVSLDRISLVSENQTIFSLENISLKYQLLPLLKKKIIIESVSIKVIDISLEEIEPGSWNFIRIMPQSEQVEENSAEASFNWQIELQELSVTDLDIAVKLLDKNPSIPTAIEDLNLNLQASYKLNEFILQLTEFNFHTVDPDLIIDNLALNCSMNNNLLEISDLRLDTEHNNFEAAVHYDMEQAQLGSLTLEAHPLYLEEFKHLLPPLPFKELPLIYLKIDLEKEHLNSEIELVLLDQSILMQTAIDSIFGNPEYRSDISFQQVNIEDWLREIELRSNLNLELAISGKGLEPRIINGSVKLTSRQSTLQDKSLNDLYFTARKNGDLADIDLKMDSFAGVVSLQGQLSKIFDIPEFSLQGEFKDLDAGKITGDDNFSSDLNFSFNLTGKGKDLNDLRSEFLLEFTPSHFGDLQFNSLITEAYYADQQYRLDQFSADISGIIIDITGSGRYNGDHDLKYSIYSQDLSSFSRFSEIEDIDGEISLRGSIKGNPDYLFNNSKLIISNLVFNDLTLDSLKADIYCAKKADIFDLDGNIISSGIQQGDLKINRVELNSKGNLSHFENQLQINVDSLLFYSDSRVILDSAVTVELPYLSLNRGDLYLLTGHDSAKFTIHDNNYNVENLLLTNGSGSLWIDGYYTSEDFADIRIELSKIDLSQFNGFQIIPFQIQGIMDFNSTLKGYIYDPELNSELFIQKPQLNEYLLQNIQADININNQLFNSDFQIVRNEHEQISGSAEFPVDLLPGHTFLADDAPLKIDLIANDLELRFIDEFTSQFENIDGILNLDCNIRNTLQDPKFTGGLYLNNGSFSFPKYGLKYNEMELNTTFNNDSLFINELMLKGGKGYLKASGFANINEFINDKNSNFEINIFADDFHVINKKNLELLTDLNIDLKGNTENPVFGGKIEIIRSKIDLDELKGNKRSSGNVTEPLLVQALASQKSEGSVIEPVRKKSPDIMKKLTGKIKILIPKNTWIRNKDMSLEISADLEVLKTGSYFEIFGSVNTIRGNYHLYGRKFSLSEGMISFNGGEQINPYLDLVIENIFRDANRNKRIMQIQLTGYALNPEIKFILDDEAVSESDAVSFLLFGKSNNEISQSEKSQVSDYGQTDFATTFLAREIGSRITDQLARKLNLNVIEFSGGDNLKSGSILIGKYITNDLFLSYQKEFSLDQSKEIVPDKVSMEFEISKYFSLQASRGDEKSTGIDLFWKFKKQ